MHQSAEKCGKNMRQIRIYENGVTEKSGGW